MVPIVVLRSRDNGQTWRAHAKGDALFRPCALGGARYASSDAGIVGAFTNFIGSPDDPMSHEVYFFRGHIEAAAAAQSGARRRSLGSPGTVPGGWPDGRCSATTSSPQSRA